MSFDIEAYRSTAGAIAYDDLDYAAFIERPLSPAALRTLRSMSDIESHTICYLRDLLVTPSHADPDVTTFLTMWAFEEYWHGEAIAKVLEAHEVTTGNQHISSVRKRLGWRDRIAPINQALLANLIGEDFVAVHMAWGAINEWSAHAAYNRLIAIEGHPELTKLLVRVIRQETRHAAFYASQARERLARSRKAQRLTRFALHALWGPVGSDLLPRAETVHMMKFLMSGPEGANLIANIDARTDKLPGLSGLRLLARAAARYGAQLD